MNKVSPQCSKLLSISEAETTQQQHLSTWKLLRLADKTKGLHYNYCCCLMTKQSSAH